MTPDLWAEKDRLERWSIESQTAFKGIVELTKGLSFQDPKPLPASKLHTVYEAALDWAMAHFKPAMVSTPTPPTKPVERTEGPKRTETKTEGFADAGQFMSACQKNLNLNPSQVLEKLSVGNVRDIPDLDKAYADLKEA